MHEARPAGRITLHFEGKEAFEHVDDPIHKDLSAVTMWRDALFVSCDETAGVDRLTRGPDGDWSGHRHFSLGDLVDLPAGPGGEMDIEGLDARDGWLWVVGSHSLKRGKAKGDPSKALARMAKIRRDPNRMFLGRFPLAEIDEGPVPVAARRGMRAECVRLRRKKSVIRKWLADDPHLGPFLDLPSKENGLDIEGIAATGARVFLGLRGPVLRGMAAVLEFNFKVTRAGHLKARRIDGRRRYRKHLIPTSGQGVRDLVLDGADLVLLTGPTMMADGAAAILRWRGALGVEASGVVPEDRIELVRRLPYSGSVDHPEGLVHWAEDRWLVVYDSPARERIERSPARFVADIWSA